MIDIKYSSYMARFSDLGLEEVFCFYPNGVWDEDKLLLSEAENKRLRQVLTDNWCYEKSELAALIGEE